MKALVIGLTELRRLTRDRTNLFFLFIFPIVLILLLGASFGGSFVPKLGVVQLDDGALADELVAAMKEDPSVEVEMLDDVDAMLSDIERGIFEAGLIIPAGYDASIEDGERVDVSFVAKAGDFSSAIRSTVDSAVGQQSGQVRAALVTADESGADFESTYATASKVADSFPGTDVTFTVAGTEDEFAGVGRFDTGASTQLLLFTFVNSLAGSVALVQTRRQGLLRRMLGTPISSTTILLGEALGRFLVALLQSLFIVFAAALLFGVGWGDPLGAGAVVTLFALVSTGAAMLAGAVLQNEQQAGALVPFGLALAALGGSMVPLEVFPDTMRAISRATPHSWANDAFDQLIGHGAGLGEILPQLGALAVFAATLLAAGSFFLRRTLTT
ncbi:MAG: ABC transporter permease [Actinomycetota bacterium]|nr:ABC transporter permease [Actinomycetota bacterium]